MTRRKAECASCGDMVDATTLRAFCCRGCRNEGKERYNPTLEEIAAQCATIKAANLATHPDGETRIHRPKPTHRLVLPYRSSRG